MPVLQAGHAVVLTVPNRRHARGATGYRCSVEDLVLQRGTADLKRVGNSLFACGGVNDEIDFPIFQHVDDMRPPLGHLVNAVDANPRIAYHPRRASGRDQTEAQISEVAGHCNDTLTVRLADR